MLFAPAVLWRISSHSLALSWIIYPSSVWAQSISIQERTEEPSRAAPVAKQTASREPEAITRPHAVSVAVEYPKGGLGEQEVVLELTISKEGTVAEARALKGDEPFSTQAVRQSKQWLFEPARRNATPVSAKIRRNRVQRLQLQVQLLRPNYNSGNWSGRLVLAENVRTSSLVR